jgi:hypothetical protein
VTKFSSESRERSSFCRQPPGPNLKQLMPNGGKSTPPRQLRIGLLVDSTIVSKYVHDFTQWSQAHERIEITHLFVLLPERNERKVLSPPAFLHPLGSTPLAAFLFKAIIKIEKPFLLKNRRHYNHLQQFDLRHSSPI